MRIQRYLTAFLFLLLCCTAEICFGATAASNNSVVVPHDDAAEEREFQNVYQDIKNPTINSGTASTFTVTNLTVTTINGSPYATSSSTWSYRRPVLQWASVNTVSVESGLDGTSGHVYVMFPDGTTRADSTTSRTTFDIRQTAIWTSGSARSGVSGSSTPLNSWYALYAVKSQINTTDIVTIGTTTLPLQANYSVLNSSFGSNGWVYLGLIRNGSGVGGAATGIASFVMAGNYTRFNTAYPAGLQNTAVPGPGLLFATTAGATSLTYTYSAGTLGFTVPANISFIYFNGSIEAVTGNDTYQEANQTYYYNFNSVSGGRSKFEGLVPAAQGFRMNPASSAGMDMIFSGWVDGSLGIGVNPLL